ncbi:MAG: cell division protein SepF [archaeon]
MVSIFGKSRADISQGRELVELDWEHPSGPYEYTLRVITLEQFTDVDKVLDSLRDKKSIVIMKLKSQFASDKVELRRALRRVQKTTYAIGGDIVGLSEDLMVVTPPAVRIDRKKGKSEYDPIAPYREKSGVEEELDAHPEPSRYQRNTRSITY